VKLAITVGTDDAHPQALVVFRGLEQSLPRIKALGYDGIELALFQAESVEVSHLRALLHEHRSSRPGQRDQRRRREEPEGDDRHRGRAPLRKPG
jgi:hypothetical protein